MLASFKMLKKIYISFPQIWNHFQRTKIQKSILLTKDSAQSIRLIDQSIVSEPVEIIADIAEKVDELNQDKKLYIANIKNFKSEMNVLSQHNPGVINFSKM